MNDWLRGSPPRMRGKLRNRETCAEQHGITPADAGKTSGACRGCGASGDHPRGCGENRHSCGRFRKAPGSPPRMRGKPLQHLGYSRQDRITPADAGKTNFSSTGINTEWDHPRGCGENKRLRNTAPPLRGITPADAGKTIIGAIGRCTMKGSPPRMRGKLLLSSALAVGQRITPADAGKTEIDVIQSFKL